MEKQKKTRRGSAPPTKAPRATKVAPGAEKPAVGRKAVSQKETEEPAAAPAEPAFHGAEDPRLRHEGQLQSERARFALSPHRKVIGEGLGTPPPGYGITLVRGLVRDPRNVVAVWDINDPAAVAQAEAIGWDRLCLRALDEGNRVLVQILVGRRGGSYHLPLPFSGLTIRLAVGIERFDGYFLTLARSAPIRVPPEAPCGQTEPYQTIRLPLHFDRRHLLAGEPPPRPGHRGPLRFSAAWRLYQRVRVALQGLQPEFAQKTARDLGWAASQEVPASLGTTPASRGAAAAWAPPGSSPETNVPQEGREEITSPAGWTWSGPAPETPAAPTSPGEWISSHLWNASGPVKEK